MPAAVSVTVRGKRGAALADDGQKKLTNFFRKASQATEFPSAVADCGSKRPSHLTLRGRATFPQVCFVKVMMFSIVFPLAPAIFWVAQGLNKMH